MGKKYKAVIFDLDGTLLNTLADIGNSVNQMLVEHGFPGHHLYAYRDFIGNGLMMVVQRALPESERSQEKIKTCFHRAREIYWDNWNRQTLPYDGVMDLLHTLEARKVPKAVLSNKPHDFTVRYVDEYFPDITFSVVMGQNDRFPVKPHPASSLDISRRVGLPPSAFLFVGDGVADVKAALSAGMCSVGVAWGFKGLKVLEENGCQMLIDHPDEIIPILDEIRKQ